MQIIKNLETIEYKEPIAVALGFFDGLHIGHTALISKMVLLAKENNIKSAVFTFNTHPGNALHSVSPQKMLTDNADKAKLIELLGVDYLIIVPFCKSFQDLTPREFVQNVLVNSLKAKIICVGEDYRFGAKASGDVKTLVELAKEYDLKVSITEKITYNGEKVCSSYIRKLIADGDIPKANELLGYDFSIKQKVVSGKQLGRIIGIPTLNQNIPENRLIPRLGVYATYVKLNDKLIPAVTNVGLRPTVDNKNLINLETHLIEEDVNLYNENIRVYYLKLLRSVKKFANTDELVAQIAIDIKNSIKYFNKFKNNTKST